MAEQAEVSLLPEKKTKKPYVPAEEKPEHKAMFLFYERLGKIRSIPKVAKEFGKSVSFITTLSRAFKWQERLIDNIKRDPIVSGTEKHVDSSRLKIIGVINDVIDTLGALALISKNIKITGLETPEDQQRVAILTKALHVYGVRITTPKDLRDLVSVLKDIIDFKSGAFQGEQAKVAKSTVNIDKLLILKGLDD